MNISFDTVKHILDTLPIGYYIKRSIPVELSKGMMSYYAPLEDKITIGYGLIAEAFVKVTDGKYDVDTEEVVRGLLYHEISHVVLTPNCLWDTSGSRNHTTINVFEDERIETIFAHRYMNTNFKKNIIFLNNYDGTTEPKDADSAFYNVVRYHKGKKQFVDRVGQIIRKYAQINRSFGDEEFHKDNTYWHHSDAVDKEKRIVREYVEAILKLYNDIAKDFEENKENQQNQQNQNGQSNDQNDQQNNDQQNQSGNGQSDDDQNNEDQQNQSGNNDQNEDEDDEDGDENQQSSGSGEDDESEDDEEDGENNDSSNDGSDNSDSNDSSNDDSEDSDDGDSEDDGDPSDTANKSGGDSEDESNPTERSNTLTDKDVEDMIDDIKTNLTEDQINDLIRKAFEAVFDVYSDEALMGRLKKIIDEKLKEDDKNGAAISAYSGVFNPRAVVRRDDYKWWSQQNVNGDIRRFSKVHFNLFIDNSGSFCPNDGNMNTFISALNKLRSKDFDFDVITVNTRVVEWPNTKKKFQSSGGNSLHASIGQVVRRHTQRQANNYNIILFDGDADPDRYGDGTTAFKYFDGPNTIIVSDKDNQRYIEKSVRQAKVIIIEDDYCRIFIDTVCDLLERVM